MAQGLRQVYYNRPMDARPPAPLWLWRLATWGFGVALVGVIGLAWGLSRGWADPPRAGPPLWAENFQGDLTRWEFITLNGATLGPSEGTLLAEFAAPDQAALGLAPSPIGDFTLEVAGMQTAGDSAAAYGLVFAWRDEAHYSAVLVNGNGYAEAYRQEGAERVEWFEWQQWPNILVGTESNRVRVDVLGRQIIARVNDEVLVEATTDAAGRMGVLARSPSAVLRKAPLGGRADVSPGRVAFSWVQMWAP